MESLGNKCTENTFAQSVADFRWRESRMPKTPSSSTQLQGGVVTGGFTILKWPPINLQHEQMVRPVYRQQEKRYNVPFAWWTAYFPTNLMANLHLLATLQVERALTGEREGTTSCFGNAFKTHSQNQTIMTKNCLYFTDDKDGVFAAQGHINLAQIIEQHDWKKLRVMWNLSMRTIKVLSPNSLFQVLTIVTSLAFVVSSLSPII